MAAPEEMTTLNLSGRFILNKSLSDSPDRILQLQGVGWLMRKMISMATITMYINHYKDDNEDEHIDIQQIGTGGFKGNPENRVLNWEDHYIDDPMYGPVVARNRRRKVEEFEDEWLAAGWSEDTIEHGLIEAYGASDTPKSGKTWSADMAWGFADVNGIRKHVRLVHFIGPKGEDIKNKLVFDYAGPETHP